MIDLILGISEFFQLELGFVVFEYNNVLDLIFRLLGRLLLLFEILLTPLNIVEELVKGLQLLGTRLADQNIVVDLKVTFS